MGILKYDKNFASQEVSSEGCKRYNLPCEPFKLYGGKYEDGVGFVRMPQDIAKEISEGVHFLSRNSAGLRLNFTTNSTSLHLIVEEEFFNRMKHMPLTGSTGFVLCSRDVKTKKSVFCGLLCPECDGSESFRVSIKLDGEMRDYILHFPLYSSVKSLAVEIDEGAYIGVGAGYKDIKPIVYYGSSITQGACASRADLSYEDYICNVTDIDYINLGFSGNGKGEDNMVDYLRAIDCSVFVCDYDHNAPTPEYLRATHERLYLRYRESKKDTPIIFVTRPDVNHSQDTDERAKIIYATYKRAKQKGDKNVYFVDGRKFFPESVKYNCQVDGCHPADLGFYFMAKKIGATIEKILATQKNNCLKQY